MDNEVKESVEKVSGLMMKEFMADVDMRHEYISGLKEPRIAEIKALSDEAKDELYGTYVTERAAVKGYPKEVFKNMTDIEVLASVYWRRNDKEKSDELLKKYKEIEKGAKDCGKDGQYDKKVHDEQSTWVKGEYAKVSPEDIREAKDKQLPEMIFAHENEKNMKKIMDAQINRSHEYSENEQFGYCLRALTASLYKQQAKYNTMDFLPKDVSQSMRNVRFVSDYIGKNYPSSVFVTDTNKTVGDIIENNNIKPGAIISLSHGGVPSHAMMYTGKSEAEEGKESEHLMMGFNNEVKASKASFRRDGTKNEAFVVDIAGLTKESLAKKVEGMSKSEAMRFLGNIEKQAKGSLVEKNFKDSIDEGKKYSSDKQWKEFYKRGDVKFDVKKRVEEAKGKIKAKREGQKLENEHGRAQEEQPALKLKASKGQDETSKRTSIILDSQQARRA